MSTYRSLSIRVGMASSFDALSRLGLAIERDRAITKAERIMLEEALKRRREYLARAAVTP